MSLDSSYRLGSYSPSRNVLARLLLIDHLQPERPVRLIRVTKMSRPRPTRLREPTQSGQRSGPGVKGVEGLALNYPPV